MQPTKCGPYKLLSILATGGMAEIFEAEPGPGAPEGLPGRLVVKRLLDRHAQNADFIELFRLEAAVAGRLDHPGIVRVFDVGEDEGQHYIAMELVPGRNLRQVAERGVASERFLPVEVAVRMIADVARALDNAHGLQAEDGTSLGLVHRDVCPHNILLAWDGRVRLTDFGIARAADQAAGVRPGQLTGRVGYLSPEQVQGLEVDRRSDLFSLAIVLYEITTGARLFREASQIETLQAVQEARVPPPGELRPGYPEALAEIVQKALARDPNERQATAGALADDLEAYLAGLDEPVAPADLAAHLALLFPEEAPTVEVYVPRAPDEDGGGPPGSSGAGQGGPADDEEIATAPSSPTPIPDDDAKVGTEALSDEDEAPNEISGDLDTVATDAIDELGAAINQLEGRAEPEAEAGGGAPGSGEADQGEPVEPAAEPEPKPEPAAPARAKRTKAVSRVHAIPKVSGDNPDDVYLSLGVGKRRVMGLGGLTAVLATVILGGLVGWFVLMPNVEHAKIRAEAQAGKKAAALAVADEPPPPAPDAELVIRSKPPNAEVVVDLMPWSERTPVTVPIHSGSSHAVMVHLPGYKPFTEQIELAPGEKSVTRQIELAKDAPPPADVAGRMTLVSDPRGATVFMAGQPKGETPVTLSGLDSRRLHVVVVRLAGHTPHVVVFQPDAGLDSLLRLELPEDHLDLDRRDLSVVTAPSDASISLGGKPAGTSPTLQRYRSGEQVEVKAVLPGYEPFHATVHLGEASTTIRAALREKPKQYGYLSLSTKPRATVYIDSSEVGRTPIKRHRLEAGKHTVIVDGEEHRGSFDVEIGADERVSLKGGFDASGTLRVE